MSAESIPAEPTPTEPSRPSAAEVARFAATFDALVKNVERAVHGKTGVVKLALTCLFAEGHLLIEDVPGVGKTLLARSIAQSVAVQHRRVQFTPDLLPSDITGALVYDQRNHRFEFRPGPIFAGVLIADEINRASPRTQSALLEAMEERQVTVDVESRPLPKPFLVVATENPADMQGTYPLPESQLDRFLMRVALDYPSISAETQILRDVRATRGPQPVEPVLSAADVVALIEVARRVEVTPGVEDYLLRIVTATRSRPEFRLGASPRGSIGLMRAAQVRAAAQRRSFVGPDDIKALAVPALAHRVLSAAAAEWQEQPATQVITEILQAEPVPAVPGAAVR